jgi:PAS domain S-box-containing protein
MRTERPTETDQLRSQTEALQQLLEVQERIVVEQAGKLEQTLAQLQRQTQGLTQANAELAREVGERIRAEAAVEQLRRQLALILDSIGEGIHWLDAEGRLVFENPTAVQMLGWEAAELIGQSIHARVHPPAPGGAACSEGACPICGHLGDPPATPAVEGVFRRKDGTSFRVEYTAKRVRNEQGQVLGTVVTFSDISARKQMEARVAAQHAVTRVLAEATSLPEATRKILQAVCECLDWDVGAIWRVDAPANLLRCVEVWHRPATQVPHFEAITRERTFPPGVGLPGRVWSAGQPVWIRDVVRDTNFPRAPFAAQDGLHGAFGFPIRLGEEVLGVMEFFSHEIRQPDDDLLRMFGAIGSQIGQFLERQRAEEQLRQTSAELARSNADLQQFASVASHDLQEPLRMVASYLQLLEKRYRGQLSPEADEFIRFAVDGAKRMDALIKGLLAYARIGAKPKPFEPIACEAVLERALANLEIALEESGATVTHGPLPAVTGDPLLLTQLFQNLIANAIKFRRQEPPRVHVAAEPLPGPPPPAWVFSVCDNGIGIERQYFERIFGLFQRLHSREQYPGTGLGLAVCKRIVERHGGRIWIESTPGVGTTFFFSLPG